MPTQPANCLQLDDTASENAMTLELFPEFPREIRTTSALPCPNFAIIEEAKRAIVKTRERYRQSQRRSRGSRSAFEAGVEAANHPSNIPAATAGTIETYQRRGQSLFARYRREVAYSLETSDLDPVDFVIWLEGVQPFWNDSTWRGNRQAASALIQTIPHANRQEALALLESIGGNQSLFSNASSSEASVACQIEYARYVKIRQALRLQSRSEVASWATDWMLVGVHVGLHPEEWRLTDIEQIPDHAEGEKFWLHVFNARIPETRLAASFRTIDLSDVSVEVRGAVERLVTLARDWTLAETFTVHKSEVSTLLQQTAAILFPRMNLNFTLDTLHHQFVANMKRLCQDEKLSALVGEMFIDKRASNYTNRRRAWDDEHITEIPLPFERDVSRFRRSLAIFEEHRALRALRDQYNQRRNER
jgi:hypothetical protein